MDINQLVRPGEKLVSPDHNLLQYSGRIGRSEEGDPKLIYPCSYVQIHFKGRAVAVVLSTKKYYGNVYAGCIIDGQQACLRLPDEDTVRVELGADMPDTDHVITIFKRQDACNNYIIRGFIVNEEAELRPCADKPRRRIEVYGDSVSAGEVSEAVMYIGQPDPEGHEGCYSNSWHSYPWITARKLKAELHDIAQGGIALLEKTGWFSGPDFIGLEQTYDKIDYYPLREDAPVWDFKSYIPHVVVVAIGQNDANPENYMKEDYEGDKADNWRLHYKDFLLKLRSLYPKALIICQTTLLCHDEAWDRAIDQVVEGLQDPKIKHFMYKLNGKGTPGHLRIPEHEMMAFELTTYIESFGEEIWQD